MDFFDKIDKFEKMANEIFDLDEDDDEGPETIEEYTAQHMARYNASIVRMKKLASLVKGVKR